MRKVANIKQDELRKEQFGVLIDVLDIIKSHRELDLFIDCFLTDSEKAFLGQRLNIMRMLAKNFSYKKIEEKLHASTVTIANVHKCLERGGVALKSLVLQYKFKPEPARENQSNTFVKPHYPGSII